MNKIRVIQYGLGPIGLGCVQNLLKARDRFELVAAIDLNPEYAGKDLGKLLDQKSLKIPVCASLDELPHIQADVAIHSTVSSLELAVPQILELVNRGLSVVSSTEEMVYPFFRNAMLTEKLDKACRRKKVAVLGMGVNPGFVMDFLPLVLSGACRDIHKVTMERIVNLSKRRHQLVRKNAIGWSPQEFSTALEENRIGHVGLVESVVLVAAGLGYSPGKITMETKPVLAESPMKVGPFRVHQGHVCGIRQRCVATQGGKTFIEAKLLMQLNAENAHDHILIKGTPPIDCVINGGIQGDDATANLLVNMLPGILNVSPGLKTLLDIPINRCVL